MKNMIIKTAVILFVMIAGDISGHAKTQNTITPNSKITSSKSTSSKKCYTFKSYREKEIRVKIAYRKLSYNLSKANYPKDLLMSEKQEFICLLKAKIIENKTL